MRRGNPRSCWQCLRDLLTLLHPKSFTISLAMAVVSDLTPNRESVRVAKSNGDSLDLPPLNASNK